MAGGTLWSLDSILTQGVGCEMGAIGYVLAFCVMIFVSLSVVGSFLFRAWSVGVNCRARHFQTVLFPVKMYGMVGSATTLISKFCCVLCVVCICEE